MILLGELQVTATIGRRSPPGVTVAGTCANVTPYDQKPRRRRRRSILLQPIVTLGSKRYGAPGGSARQVLCRRRRRPSFHTSVGRRLDCPTRAGKSCRESVL